MDIGCNAELIRIPASERTFEDVLANYRHAKNLKLDDFEVVISTKAPTYVVEHPCHIVYLVHTVRAFDDMFEVQFPERTHLHYQQRKIIHDLDYAGLRKAKAIFCIGHEVKDRLHRKFGLKACVQHPPLMTDRFRLISDDGSFLLPGRLHPWKRVDLAIRAVKESTADVLLNIVGQGEAEQSLKALAADDKRIRFLGGVLNAELAELYGRCRAVVFVPLREDYGFVTLEAFASGKPVITCRDSGEPTRFVKNAVTGLIVDPDPAALARAMAALHDDGDLAFHLGQAAAARIPQTSWSEIASTLLNAALSEAEPVDQTMPVTVVDMQPIEPTVGGGRLRLFGLFHNLGPSINATYVGTYDWPGEKARKLQLTDRLTEITIPLSEEHHSTASDWAERAGGKVVIDISFSELGGLSTNYLDQVRESISDAKVVIFSHPWVFPLVRDAIQPHQLVVYDSQNVEVYLRRSLLNVDNPFERRLLEFVARDEDMLLRQADIVFACSHDDALRFQRIYDAPFSKMRVVPNGVMTGARRPASDEQRAKAKLALALDKERITAIFVGSLFEPNVQAAQFIAGPLAKALPDVTFVIAGGVGAAVSNAPANVLVTGSLSAPDLDRWLAAADLAINPMFSGSGTNIKMFDFMASGLPVVTTAIGARGIISGGADPFRIVDGSVDAFASEISRLRSAADRRKLGELAREVVERSYSWEVISYETGKLIANWQNGKTQKKPLFSIIIPSYERHDQLLRLLNALTKQTERDFEVIVIDQSQRAVEEANEPFGFELSYVRSSIKGAVYARNLGAQIAKGEIIAFTDDDCIPHENWLLNARKYFQDPTVVGVEGLIYSDRLSHPEWRPVSNLRFAGVGFMAANLLVRQSVFQQIGGFDPQFDNPHFREDTDLGWRMQQIGAVPYAADVRVFHPAHRRSVERESVEARLGFFEKDALLARKHPEKFRALYLAERHYELTPGYLETLFRSFEKHSVDIPQWLAPGHVPPSESPPY